ncbi:MAG: DUF1848 domain-containing protein [Eubacteriales bacterium]|nr:DUF1848 domain-containing protein [Eubacteriales bacterium]
MIMSASRRTDIPALYAEWFMNRIREGYVLTRNPMNRAQLSRLTLSPDIVDCIVFWTKDAANMLPYLNELDRRGYKYYFQFTLTPYGKELEPGLREKAGIEDTFITLSERIGKSRLVWRYDPVILNEIHDIKYHKTQFWRMCNKLSSYTDTVTVSFVDMYSKFKNIGADIIRPLADDEIFELAVFIGTTAKEFGLKAVACCEKYDLTPYGIGKSSCIDRERIEKLLGCPLDIGADKNQRPGCGCCESVDIGAYDTCTNGCVYCYANDGVIKSARRRAAHDPLSGLLTGFVAEGEAIKEKQLKSNRI